MEKNSNNINTANSKLDSDEPKSVATAAPADEQNPNSPAPEDQNPDSNQAQPRQSSRTPFTNLSQVDADLALARALQEQERAFMMIRMNGEGSDYGSWEAGSYINEEEFDDPNDGTDVDDGVDVDDGADDDDEDEDKEEDEGEYDGTEEDAFDVHDVEFDPTVFSSDEDYARALQRIEEQEMAARLLALAGLGDHEADDAEDYGGNTQDTWEELDPDELSYEELLALGEVVGTESRGLSSDTIASLPSVTYTTQSSQEGSNDSCVICRLDYEDGETLTVLSCKHSYHSECINNWLQINKVCPICSTEVSSSR